MSDKRAMPQKNFSMKDEDYRAIKWLEKCGWKSIEILRRGIKDAVKAQQTRAKIKGKK